MTDDEIYDEPWLKAYKDGYVQAVVPTFLAHRPELFTGLTEEQILARVRSSCDRLNWDQSKIVCFLQRTPVTDYEMTQECRLEVSFHYNVSRGLTSEDEDNIEDVYAVIYGPKGESLRCPDWLTDLLLGDEGTELLYHAASPSEDSRHDDIDD